MSVLQQAVINIGIEFLARSRARAHSRRLCSDYRRKAGKKAGLMKEERDE